VAHRFLIQSATTNQNSSDVDLGKSHGLERLSEVSTDLKQTATVRMCYYDNSKFVCGDWKWGNFRQHCQKEYRRGETCGMKMVFQTLQLAEKCTFCEKIERKQRRYDKLVADYQRWARDGDKFRASMEKAMEDARLLQYEINVLKQEKEAKYKMIGNTRRC